MHRTGLPILLFPEQWRIRAFTLTEVLVVMGILAILLALVLPAIGKVRSMQRATACIATLHQISTAFHAYAGDNKMRLPDPSTANASWEQMLSKYHQAPFACPGDEELFSVFGSSYDWRDTGDSATSLAGRPLADAGRGDAIMVFDALPGWHARHKFNVSRIDGSVDAVDEQRFFEDLQLPLRAGISTVR